MDSLSLYIHVPFCMRKCSYCDFVSYSYSADAAESYLTALELELQHYACTLSRLQRQPATVFIGGGTPTVLKTAQLEKLLLAVQKYFHWAPNAEVTIEANPGTVNWEKLYTLKQLGVNRLSIGVQACQQHLLNLLGRVHNYQQAVQAVADARCAGFENINLDLIFGLPNQSLTEWQQSLRSVLDLSPRHLSCYSLQLEENTPLTTAVECGRLNRCSEELELAMYQETIDFLAANGYLHYEISNFAQPGFQSKHNLVYWHNGYYLGLGPAAHSHVNNERWANTGGLEEYVSKLTAGELPVSEHNSLTVKDDMIETAIMGLRLLEGLSLCAFYERFRQDVQNVWPKQIAELCAQGLLELTATHLKLTQKGLPLANVVFAEFV